MFALADIGGMGAACAGAELDGAGSSLLATGADEEGAGVAAIGAAAVAGGSALAMGGSAVATSGAPGDCCGSGGDQFALWQAVTIPSSKQDDRELFFMAFNLGHVAPLR